MRCLTCDSQHVEYTLERDGYPAIQIGSQRSGPDEDGIYHIVPPSTVTGYKCSNGHGVSIETRNDEVVSQFSYTWTEVS